MADLDFNKMADPEKLRSALRERFAGMSDKDLDDMVKDDRMLHQLELVEHLYKWQRRHEEICKAKGDDVTSVDYIADMMKVMSSYLIGFVNLKDPVAAITGARGIASVMTEIWAKAVSAAIMAHLSKMR